MPLVPVENQYKDEGKPRFFLTLQSRNPRVRDTLDRRCQHRAAAFSAMRAGLSPWCVDLFGDSDLPRRLPDLSCQGSLS